MGMLEQGFLNVFKGLGYFRSVSGEAVGYRGAFKRAQSRFLISRMMATFQRVHII